MEKNNRGYFCHAVLKQFTKGLEKGRHASEVVDLYAIRFNLVFHTQVILRGEFENG